MKFPLFIAVRYLFAKRNTNAINIISGISVLGITIGTAALVLILSVFNGFEDLLSGLFGHFNPPLKVIPAKGKFFDADSITLDKLRHLPGVSYVSESLEEVAFFEYDGSQDFGILKGVDGYFSAVTGIDSTVREGKYKLEEGDNTFAVLGVGMRNKLSVNTANAFEPLAVYMPLEKQGAALDKPFKTRYLNPVGTFVIQQDYDQQYVLTSLTFMRSLLESPLGLSSLEIKLNPTVSPTLLKKQVSEIVGDGFVVKDRFEQNEAFFKVMNLEKWMGYALASLMLLLMAFNMIGALWMIVLDKQRDISILKSMGASDGTLHRVFLLEGIILTVLGMISGYILAVVLYFLQKKYGLISVPEGFLVDSYPISMRAKDFIPVTFTVLIIGLLASLPPAWRAMRVPAFLREE